MSTTIVNPADTDTANTTAAGTGVLRRVLRRLAAEVRRAMAQVGEPHKDGALPM